MKTIVPSFLILFSLTVHSEWELSSSVEGNTVYIDDSLIKVTGRFVKVLEIVDSNTPTEPEEGKKYLSSKVLVEYDCPIGKLRIHSFIAFSDNMGKGSIVYTEKNPTPWVKVLDNSNGYNIYQIVCKKSLI